MKSVNARARFAFVAIALGGLALLSGCAGTREAYKAADTLEDKAFVATEHYSAVLKQAADLKVRGVLKGEALARVQEAELVAAPLIREIGPLVKAYKAVRSAETEVALQNALDNAILALANLVRLVKASASGGA